MYKRTSGFQKRQKQGCFTGQSFERRYRPPHHSSSKKQEAEKRMIKNLIDAWNKEDERKREKLINHE